MGGIYADINYIFYRRPDNECNTYDFFSESYSAEYMMSIDNFFFAARPNHPVIISTQNTVRKNMLSPSKSLKILYNESISSFTDKASADPIGKSFFKEAHKNGNVDVIFPKSPSKISRNDSVYTEDRDYFFENLETNTWRLCPEYRDFIRQEKQQEEYTLAHELCPLMQNIIGEGLPDSGSWKHD